MKQALLALTFALGGCAMQPGGLIGSGAPYDLAEERAEPGEPAPHVVVLEKDGRTVSVFGTTHLVPDTLRWMSAATEARLRSADLILTETSVTRYDEVKLSPEDIAALAPVMVMPPGETLWQAAERRRSGGAARIRTALETLELASATYTPLRPWVVCRDLQIPPKMRSQTTDEDRRMVAELSRNFGAPDLLPPDVKIELFGAVNGIPTVYLESEYARALNFSRLGDADALDCALTTAERMTSPRSGVEAAAQYGRLLSLWIAGAAEPARVYVERDQTAINPAWSHIFLQEREAAWLSQIGKLCDAGRRDCFVAVGLAHLGGPDGLLKGLERMGYRPLPAGS